jgi:hypothetical protein
MSLEIDLLATDCENCLHLQTLGMPMRKIIKKPLGISPQADEQEVFECFSDANI